MVADIFCPIFTLKITILANFIQKKFGGLAPTRASPWILWWAYSLPHTPSCRKNDAPIFSLDYPLLVHVNYKKHFKMKLLHLVLY